MKSTMSQNCNEIDRAIGIRLRDFRKMAGLSQERLGGDIGVTFQQIQKYEKGTNRVSTSALILICQKLGISPMDVIGVYFGKSSDAAEVMDKALQTNRQLATKLLKIKRILVDHDDAADLGSVATRSHDHASSQVIQ